MSGRAGLLSLALVAGCGAHIPPHTVHVPPLIADVRPVPSVVFLQTPVPIDALRTALERAIPPSRSDETTLASGVKLRSTFERSAFTVRASAEGLVLEVGIDIAFSSDGGAMACKSRNAAMHLKAIARPELMPDGWLILAAPKTDSEVRGSLSCGILPIPLSPLLSPIAAGLGRGLEEAVRLVRLPLGPLIDQTLDTLAQPRTVTLGSGASQETACLDLAPRALVMSPLAGSGDTLMLKLGVDVAPRLSTGKCTIIERPPVKSHVIARELPLADSFTVEVALAVPYDELTRRAAPSLRGKSFGDGRQQVFIREVTFGDAQGRVLARAQVDGAITGTLWLWGTPAVSERDGRFVIAVPDLQVAVETRDALTRMKLWFWQQHDGGLATWLRDKLSVDITDCLTAARSALTGRRVLLPGSPSLALVTSFTRVVPSQVSSRPGALTARVSLIGSAELAVTR